MAPWAAGEVLLLVDAAGFGRGVILLYFNMQNYIIFLMF
jgi:hypothetical protein